MTTRSCRCARLHAGYGSIRVLHGIDFEVEDGAIVALLGANGAGKTTTLRALSGMIPARGQITLDGRDVSALGAAERARLGIAHVPQGRGTFVDFTVEENLALGAYTIARQAHDPSRARLLVRRLSLARRAARPAGRKPLRRRAADARDRARADDASRAS